MALTPGTRLGSYEILSALGAGGMGEVYRARDTKLGRDVALKTLPASVVHDPERLARFEREARTLASLNHPHIAQIYGFEQSGDTSALVMELVEGDDLSARIAPGPLPLEDALPIARQIAEALEAAHEHGIIHRDLKPANIKVRADGTVKVLDFGLAKAMEPRAGVEGHRRTPTLSPTITSPAMTMRGTILGTAAYMSPEQAKGKPVDVRSDIWAFGCVLYEMLTGRRAFEGEDVSDTLAAILRGEPDWTRLPALPSALNTLLRRCMERDWRRRIASMSVVRFVLDDPAMLSQAGDRDVASPGELHATIEVALAQARRQWLVRAGIPLLAFATIAVIAAAMGFARQGNRTPSPPAVARFAFPVPERRAVGVSFRNIALSPNGNELAYVTEGQMLMRRLSQFEMAPISSVDLGGNLQLPAFSPDGEWIAYYTAEERVVKKVSVRGGAALAFAKWSPSASTGTCPASSPRHPLAAWCGAIPPGEHRSS